MNLYSLINCKSHMGYVPITGREEEGEEELLRQLRLGRSKAMGFQQRQDVETSSPVAGRQSRVTGPYSYGIPALPFLTLT